MKGLADTRTHPWPQWLVGPPTVRQLKNLGLATLMHVFGHCRGLEMYCEMVDILHEGTTYFSTHFLQYKLLTPVILLSERSLYYRKCLLMEELYERMGTEHNAEARDATSIIELKDFAAAVEVQGLGTRFNQDNGILHLCFSMRRGHVDIQENTTRVVHSGRPIDRTCLLTASNVSWPSVVLPSTYDSKKANNWASVP